MKIFIPQKTEYMTIENFNNIIIYVYNTNFYLKIKTNKYKSNIQINTILNIIILTNRGANNKLKLLNNYINNLIFSWNNFYFEKIKFTGKGYKIKKSNKKNSLALLFNRAHPTMLFTKKIIFKKIKKTKIIIMGVNFHKLKFIRSMIVAIRKYNTYTKRGLRGTRSLIIKKSSKKTAAV